MSGLEIRSPWRRLTEAEVGRVEAAVGVYELRGPAGTMCIDYAGARSRLGLRGELRNRLTDAPADTEFRSEVVTTYLSRWAELLGHHLARHGKLPPQNVDDHPHNLKPIGSRKVPAE